MRTKQALRRAAAKFATQQEFADALGVSRQRVNQLLKQSRVSAEIAVAIERATGGAVMRAELRPDLFGDAA